MPWLRVFILFAYPNLRTKLIAGGPPLCVKVPSHLGDGLFGLGVALPLAEFGGYLKEDPAEAG
jgi:hypothetical protein